VTEAGALDAIDRILNRGGDADDVLREVVDVLPAQVPGVAWAGVFFSEGGELVPGPAAGDSDEGRRVHVPVAYRGECVGELAIDGEAGPAFLERVATLISAHVLIGWDTRGERWEP
jgi:putative methionine-R-sulfoxide reductase with GAF domain